MRIEYLGVVGAGQMGSGIAQICAMARLQVTLCDINSDALKLGMAAIKTSLNRLAAKEKLSLSQAEDAMGRITTSTELASISKVDLVIEAVTENESVKLAIFRELDQICRADTILATNTSSISITRLAAATHKPGRVIGMHFMNPVVMMNLVEIIRALQTDDEVFKCIEFLVRQIDKVPVGVRDAPGFVANRILLPMINEAIFCLHEGLASAEEIDTVMKLGMNHPIGPLALADRIGLDTCLSIIEVLYHSFKDSKYRPCPLLVQMVDAGQLGRKSGCGFYDYKESTQ